MLISIDSVELDQLRADAAAARVDELTGALSRRGLARAYPRLRPRMSALMFLDLDRFKSINDEYGHAAGDAVLRVVARRVHQHAHGVTRLGGDEFVGFLDGATPAAVAQRIVDLVAVPISVDSQLVATVTASIGVAEHPDAELAETLLRADLAMYRAKHTGGGVAVYDPAVDVPSPRPSGLRRGSRAAKTREGAAA